MRQTDKSLQSEKFKQVVGGLGKPLGKNPAPRPDPISLRSGQVIPALARIGIFWGGPGVLSTAEGPRPFQPRNPQPPQRPLLS